jgi:hypothetical protein
VQLASGGGGKAGKKSLFKRFEKMIERNEAQLVKARSDLLDVINRPGPGLLFQPPIFIEKPLKRVLACHKWHSALASPFFKPVDHRLESAIRRCNRKVSAHLNRVALFREQIASAQLIQGALAAGRAAKSREEHVRQRLDQEALDHFRAVRAIPGHQEDLAALELMSHQLARSDRRNQSAINAYEHLIGVLDAREASPSRNLVLVPTIPEV